VSEVPKFRSCYGGEDSMKREELDVLIADLVVLATNEGKLSATLTGAMAPYARAIEEADAARQKVVKALDEVFSKLPVEVP
jgi:hypothetical protein